MSVAKRPFVHTAKLSLSPSLSCVSVCVSNQMDFSFTASQVVNQVVFISGEHAQMEIPTSLVWSSQNQNRPEQANGWMEGQMNETFQIFQI